MWLKESFVFLYTVRVEEFQKGTWTVLMIHHNLSDLYKIKAGGASTERKEVVKTKPRVLEP